ncbi:MAG TPA: hypothetical protein PLJ42_10725 [Chitinophagales bacterium]|jgi:hypothetical protein|nr:hypothetical protein [Chitinophagales bacterium]MBP6153422.1 hypothetical protein [Chitinophagales bacterium]HQV79149.1 hypothetical protein [Chitinophagales bacterium]HQW79895.1 hypothetical protein [Chitinophagales bacterium]HRB67009.1 hypothetical protein [Chitinophagales bacterium]
MNTYVFDSSTKKNIFITLGIGVLMLILGVLFFDSGSHEKEASHSATHTAVTTDKHTTADEHTATADHGHAAPTVKTSLIANTHNVLYFFFYIALASIFFLAATNIAWGGWQIQIQKIALAMSVPIVLFIILLFVVFGLFNHDIFHWTHESLYAKGTATFDEILNTKSDFLNMKTFWGFSVVIAILCVFMVMKFWNVLTKMDVNPTRKLFSSSRVIAAVSIVVISFLINTFATWLWSMSIQPHWYSTMFTWNTMAGACVTMLSILLLFMHYLKSKGYLPNVNQNHEHDVAKLMFAISIFWCYTWFSQYMLIWYANIPEETEYFRLRRNMDNYGILFHASFVFNFVLPFFILLTRNSKRSTKITIVTAIIIILGQYAAFFIMNCPPLLPKNGFGLISLGLLLIFGSIFTYVTLVMLAKVKDLSSSTHPYFKESYNHHI